MTTLKPCKVFWGINYCHSFPWNCRDAGSDSKDRWARPLTDSSLCPVPKRCLISWQPHRNERHVGCDRGLRRENLIIEMGFTPFLRCSWGSGNQALCSVALPSGHRFSEQRGKLTHPPACLWGKSNRREQGPSDLTTVTAGSGAGDSTRLSGLPAQCPFLGFGEH